MSTEPLGRVVIVRAVIDIGAGIIAAAQDTPAGLVLTDCGRRDVTGGPGGARQIRGASDERPRAHC